VVNQVKRLLLKLFSHCSAFLSHVLSVILHQCCGQALAQKMTIGTTEHRAVRSTLAVLRKNLLKRIHFVSHLPFGCTTGSQLHELLILLEQLIIYLLSPLGHGLVVCELGPRDRVVCGDSGVKKVVVPCQLACKGFQALSCIPRRPNTELHTLALAASLKDRNLSFCTMLGVCQAHVAHAWRT
jgi:hypothetical protein